MKNFFKFLGIIALVAVIGFAMVGCATTGGGGSEPGSLTITGIPAEFNGKFASFPYGTDLSRMRNKLIASAEDPRKLLTGKIEGAVITNGEVKLLIFRDMPVVGLTAYNGSETTRIELCIRDTAESGQATTPSLGVDRAPDFIFKSVTFENGVAVAKWDDVFEVGSITVTGIPGRYGSSNGGVVLNLKFGNTTYSYSIVGTKVNESTRKMKFYRDKEAEYTPYNGTTDINLSLGDDHFQFQAVQITNDNATLDFAQGVRQ